MWIDGRGSEVLSSAECLRLLAEAAKKGSIGRLAVSQDGAPIVHPVNFAYVDRQVVVRLGPGLMEHAAAGALVAFEVDEVDREGAKAWSVLVRGLATELAVPAHPDAARPGPAPLVPEPGEKLLAVRADVVTGRRFQLR
ncbi:MAG TPA: pyridoxamine 5'-phosphate oxidase family protein [Acidimicrobiales bacterium]|nr:pyridoxamine 5'-phosphate oxidase family protein [Acidimicrobiales bacterium]